MSKDDEDEKRPPQRTYRGFATPGIDEPPRSEESSRASKVPPTSEWSAPAELESAPPIELDQSGELYLPPGTSRTGPRTDEPPLVEIEVVHRRGAAPRMDQPPQTLEVWTRNRVYVLDPHLVCVGVADLGGGPPDPRHPFVGYRLVGGQHRDGDTFELSYPFPRPGTEAVFEHPTGVRGNFSRTSTVTRVVLRLHVVTVAPSVVVPTWSTITSPGISTKK